MARVTLHMLVKYRSQAKNVHNITKIYMRTTSYMSLIAAATTDHESDSGKMFFSSPVLKDGGEK